MQFSQKRIAYTTLILFITMFVVSFTGLFYAKSGTSFINVRDRDQDKAPKYQFYDILTERKNKTPSTDKSGLYFIQVGYFTKKEDANRLSLDIKKKGVQTKVIEVKDNYAVITDNYDYSKINQIKDSLNKKGFETIIKNN